MTAGYFARNSDFGNLSLMLCLESLERHLSLVGGDVLILFRNGGGNTIVPLQLSSQLDIDGALQCSIVDRTENRGSHCWYDGWGKTAMIPKVGGYRWPG